MQAAVIGQYFLETGLAEFNSTVFSRFKLLPPSCLSLCICLSKLSSQSVCVHLCCLFDETCWPSLLSCHFQSLVFMFTDRICLSINNRFMYAWLCVCEMWLCVWPTICSDLVQKKTMVFAMFLDIETASRESMLVTVHSLTTYTHETFADSIFHQHFSLKLSLRPKVSLRPNQRQK